MMSIASASSGDGGYYINLATEDYYLQGGEPRGIWIGQGARDLHLTGIVERQSFSLLLHGYSPDGKELIKNAGVGNHQAGWDITLSAPKSVSVVWSQADEPTRLAIQKAQQKAVEATLAFVEEEFATTRRGQGGREKEPARLICATFEHGTARQTKDALIPDPNLHSHCFVMNACTRADGSTGTIESKPFYLHQHVIDAIYKTKLAFELREINFGIEPTRHGFEIQGVPRPVIEEFSKRSQVIREEMQKNGVEGAKAAEIANLATREVKGHFARSLLFAEWQRSGQALGFSTEEVRALQKEHRQAQQVIHPQDVIEAISVVMDEITRDESHFSKFDFLRHLARETQGKGIDSSTLRAVTKEFLSSSKDIVALGQYKGAARYTTAAMLALEREILALVDDSQKNRSHRLLSPSVWAGIRVTERQGKIRLNDEQKDALRHITQNDGSIQVVSGMAGTGKTTMLKAARIAWEREDYKVLGTALSGKAAKGLEEGTKIRSLTVAGLLKAMEGPTFGEQIQHELWQVGRNLIGKGRYNLTPLKLTSKTVLIVDEAGMVDTRNMAKLVKAVHEVGGKLILVGDARQLQPVEAGGPFRSIAERVGEAKLTQIVRQREEWARKTVHQFADGNARAALETYLDKGLLTVSRTRTRAMEALIEDWKKTAATRPEKALILAGTNAETRKLNEMAQEVRKEAGMLGHLRVKVKDQTLHTGDRVLFTQNASIYGVRNGDLGTIRLLEPFTSNIMVKLDSGKRVYIPLNDYDDVTLGYAVTTHKGQGITVDRAFVLAGGNMADLHLSYVQASRARGDTRFYTEWRYVGDTMNELANEMSRDRQKVLAQDILKQQEEQGIGQYRNR